MKKLEDLLIHQLRDLHSAENQILKLIPKLIEQASDEKLKDLLKIHLEETKHHIKRLHGVFNNIQFSPEGEFCKATEGLINEAENFLKHDLAPEVKDAGIIAEAQRLEHYEIAGYGTVVRYARELGLNTAKEILKKTLKDKYEANDNLNEMAENRLNRKAIKG